MVFSSLAVISKTAISTAVLCFMGYCFYFDRKRRSDPNFKLKLRIKRQRARVQEQTTNAAIPTISDVTDQQDMPKLFMGEVELAKFYLNQGNVESGVEHLAYAVIISKGFPNVLYRTLPDHVFKLLIEKLRKLGTII